MENPYLYLIMRGDMPSMNPGKLAAQAAHGASMFHEVARDMTNELVAGTYPAEGTWQNGYLSWVKSAKNFGTTIVLTATRKEILDLKEEFGVISLDGEVPKDSFVYDEIIDPSYPFTMEAEIYNYLMDDDVLHGFENVSDIGNGRVFATRKEMSGFWVFGSKDELQPYLGHLKLYP